MKHVLVLVTAFVTAALLFASGCGSSASSASQLTDQDFSTLAQLFHVQVETGNLEIAFQTVNQNDPNLSTGTTETRQQGVNGLRHIGYADIYLFGNLVLKVPYRSDVSSQPVNQIVAVGTAPANADYQIASNDSDPTYDSGPTYEEQKAAAMARLKARADAEFERRTEQAPPFGTPVDCLSARRINCPS